MTDIGGGASGTSSSRPFIDFANITSIDHFKLMLKDIFGEEKAIEISQDIGQLLSLLLGWREVRPWGEFFAVFKPPQLNLGLLEQRLATNFLHYRSNYLVLCTGIFTIRAIFAPVMLMSIVLCLSLALYFLVIVKLPIVLGQYTLKYREKSIFLVIFSLFFMSVTGALVRLIWTLLMMLLVCALHMIFRPRSVTAKTNEVYEELKVNGFSWFRGNFGSGSGSSSVDNDSDVETGSQEPMAAYALKDGIISDAVRKRNSGITVAPP